MEGAEVRFQERVQLGSQRTSKAEKRVVKVEIQHGECAGRAQSVQAWTGVHCGVGVSFGAWMRAFEFERSRVETETHSAVMDVWLFSKVRLRVLVATGSCGERERFTGEPARP